MVVCSLLSSFIEIGETLCLVYKVFGCAFPWLLNNSTSWTCGQYRMFQISRLGCTCLLYRYLWFAIYPLVLFDEVHEDRVAKTDGILFLNCYVYDYLMRKRFASVLSGFVINFELFCDFFSAESVADFQFSELWAKSCSLCCDSTVLWEYNWTRVTVTNCIRQ